MGEIVDLQQKRIDIERPTLGEIIDSFTSHNCDKNRPETGQQPLRAAMEIKGLSRRDICDCMVLGILECRDSDKYGELPRIYVSEAGNLYKEWADIEKANEGFSDSYVDPERVTYNDLYGWNLDEIDPVAAVQNMACHLERRMGVFPALIDGELSGT